MKVGSPQTLRQAIDIAFNAIDKDRPNNTETFKIMERDVMVDHIRMFLANKISPWVIRDGSLLDLWQKIVDDI